MIRGDIHYVGKTWQDVESAILEAAQRILNGEFSGWENATDERGGYSFLRQGSPVEAVVEDKVGAA